MDKKYEDSINSMVKKIIDNKSSRTRGFIIATSIMSEDCHLINSKVNSRSIDKTTDYKNHGETKCYDKVMKPLINFYRWEREYVKAKSIFLKLEHQLNMLLEF